MALGGAVVSAECWDTRVDTMLQTRKFLWGSRGWPSSQMASREMHTVAARADFKTLNAAYGGTELSALQAAHKVCCRLETLLKARLVFLQRQCAMNIVKA